MARLRPLPVFALAAWSLFLWASRLGLAWETEPTLGRKLLATIPVAIFVALGVATLVALLRRPAGERGEVLVGWGRTLVWGFAAWTIGYWLVRMPMIATSSRAVGFKAVHAVLATVSVGISVLVLRTRRSARPAPRTPSLA